jgi:hypothetical protein
MRLLLAVAASVAISACSNGATKLSATGTSPGATFSASGTTVPLGIVLAFAASSEASTPVTATVDDATIATVTPTVNAGTFVLVGVATGQTILRVFVNDADAIDVPVQVIPPAD